MHPQWGPNTHDDPHKTGAARKHVLLGIMGVTKKQKGRDASQQVYCWLLLYRLNCFVANLVKAELTHFRVNLRFEKPPLV